MEIDQMQAGREMDALVAEIMGWRVLGFAEARTYECSDDWVIHGEGGTEPVYLSECYCEDCDKADAEFLASTGIQPDPKIFGHHRICLEVVPLFSTEIAAAWKVIEKLSERGWYFEISTDAPHIATFCARVRDGWNGTWSKAGNEDGWVTEYGHGTLAPLAICRAALKAVSHD